MLAHGWLLVFNIAGIMGRPEQRERKRKQAAASSQRIDSLFAPAAKRTKESSSVSPSTPSTENSQNAIAESESRTELRQQDAGDSNNCQNTGVTTEAEVCGEDLSLSPAAAEPRRTSLHVDIGDIIDGCSSEESVHLTLRNLPREKKYSLLKNHSRPTKDFAFPTTYIGGCNRRFRSVWLHEYPWMVYSTKLDGGFCVACTLFNTAGNTLTGKFLTRPFNKWNKKSLHCGGHEKSAYHETCLKLADDFICRFEKPETELPNQLDQRRVVNIEQNRKILKSITHAVLFCGRQCIALRGDNEDIIAGEGNPGNLLALLKLLAVHDDALRAHLDSPAMRNATYLSHRTQNEIIEVLGQHNILKDIIEEIKQAQFYAILADEMTSHNQEYLVLCVRFVAEDKAVREEFLGFLKLERITGEEIAGTIVKFLRDHGITLEGMRGQGYDGAANMSSDRVGVQKCIRDLAPHATYIHCHSHSLNLVITHTCSLPDIRNIVDKLQHCCHFFLNSPKRSGALEVVVTAIVDDSQRRKPLLDLCKTRWAERHNAYQHFYQAYTFIVQTLELIGYGRHADKYGDKYSQWDPSNKSEAQQILASITASTFIVGFMCVYHYLSHLSGITVKLQRRSKDVMQAYAMITEVKDVYTKERQDVDKGFGTVFKQCQRMGEAVESPITMPRITARQQHRSNQESLTPEDYYKKAVAIPFLDHLLTSLNDQFSKSAIIASSLLGLVPSVLCCHDTSLDAIAQEYKDDLPSPELLSMEVRRWKARYVKMPENLRPESPAQAIDDCDADMYPNIFILLKIACTILATSCECEHSASALRRLHN